jgi:hypothetical protein
MLGNGRGPILGRRPLSSLAGPRQLLSRSPGKHEGWRLGWRMCSWVLWNLGIDSKQLGGMGGRRRGPPGERRLIS